MAALAFLGAEFPTKDAIQEAEELEGAVVASVLDMILSWERIFELLPEDIKIR